jgi:trehalose-phosphatase
VNSILQALPQNLDRPLFLGLDRDGTLVPYADRPEQAVPDPDLRSTLFELALLPQITIAIVSARSVAQLQVDFGHQSIILAGNYGLDIRFPGGQTIVQKEAVDAVPRLKQVRERLAKLVEPPTNAILEDHRFSLCLHWHTVPQNSLAEVHKTVQTIKGLFPDLTFRALPTSYEVLPGVKWDKSKALDILDQRLIAKTRQCFYAYAGDSPADEPAFAWVNKRQGASIKVGDISFVSCAKYHLGDALKLKNLLEELLLLRVNLRTKS